MKRNLLFAVPVCMASALACSAQVQLSTADLLRLEEIKGDMPGARSAFTPKSVATDAESRMVEILVRFDDESTLAAVESNGGEILDRLTSHAALVRVPLEQATEVVASKGVKSASLSRMCHPKNMAARNASNVDAVHAGTDLQMPFTGEGVVVGVFDVGMDPNHINFRDADGKTRVKRVWSYPGASSLPSVYGTTLGVERFTTDNTTDSHGTHVLGIAAGSFVDPNGTLDYHGMAPGADIAIGCGLGYNGQILSAMKNIASYAKSEGKPCVMNLSFGDNIGPHDGTDDFAATLNEIVEENNALICMAAGNERDLPISFIKTFSDEDSELRTLLLGNSDLIYAGGQNMQTYGEVQVWSEDATPVEVSLEIVTASNYLDPPYTLTLSSEKGSYLVSGTTYMQSIPNYRQMNIISDESAFTSKYTQSYVGGECGVDPVNGRYCAKLNTYLKSSSYLNTLNTFVCLHIKGEPGKKVFVYCDGYYNQFGSKNLAGMENFTGNGTISNMASGKNTMAVGSYVSANVVGSGYPSGVVKSPSFFSSFGETCDGRVLPDICAPGQVIISSRNSSLATSNQSYPVKYTYNDAATSKTYRWTICAGTSQASPHMAGVAALWLQANPNLTFGEIKEIAHATAAKSSVEGDGWGAGMVDAYAGLKMALSKLDGNNSVENVFESVSEPIMITPTGAGEYEIFAPGQGGFSVSVVNMAGAVVGSYSSDGDTFQISTNGMAPGMYILSAVASRASKTLKIAGR